MYRNGKGEGVFGQVGFLTDGDNIYFAWYIYRMEYRLADVQERRSSWWARLWKGKWETVIPSLKPDEVKELKCFFKHRAMESAVPKIQAIRY